MDAIREEMRRTAYQKKAVSRLPADEVIAYAISWFQDHGYRAGLTGRPNQMYILGGKEGVLPRVTGEIKVQSNVGKGRVTMVTMDATGANLREVMAAFHASLRSWPQQSRASEEPATES